MPVPSMTAELQIEAIAKLDSCLSTIFEEKQVRKDVQATLANRNITGCETFSLIEESPSALRNWLHGDDVGVAKDGADKVAAAKFYGGMGAARERTKTQRTKQAELAKRSSRQNSRQDRSWSGDTPRSMTENSSLNHWQK